ncbi:ferredoxin-NADP reductase [Bradyrhizobium macuxiense]|uniref:Ferredoxin-NADP reductase n=1 Tax=Bradyrhizobium macuxiense TaxID=1755647 RepID=A0A560KWY3_9BRAD|nr:PDR/VanB family oxidoreductase [Bradyrhizobium macuxiense]TWB87746.1 ferredoxin-NADP reductase [Bradyrhizobium macuxiense]
MNGGRAALCVEQKELVAEGVVRLRLVDPRGVRLPDWAPGAHIDLNLSNGLTRQYSLCGNRWDAMSYEIAVLLEPNSRGGSEFIHRQLQVGDLVQMGGPRNNFRLVPADSYLFVAGGIGITPLLPMIEHAAKMEAPWTLLYSGRQLSSMAFIDRLQSYGDRVVIRSRDTQGRFDLGAAVSNLRQGAKVYCCGPTSMIDALEQFCRSLPTGALRRERFTAKVQTSPARSTAYEVELARSGKVLTVEPGESVLNAILKAGAPLLASCREGLCGTCETTVLSGVPDHRDSILSDTERERNLSFYPCVSRAASDRLVIDL